MYSTYSRDASTVNLGSQSTQTQTIGLGASFFMILICLSLPSCLQVFLQSSSKGGLLPLHPPAPNSFLEGNYSHEQLRLMSLHVALSQMHTHTFAHACPLRLFRWRPAGSVGVSAESFGSSVSKSISYAVGSSMQGASNPTPGLLTSGKPTLWEGALGTNHSGVSSRVSSRFCGYGGCAAMCQ